MGHRHGSQHRVTRWWSHLGAVVVVTAGLLGWTASPSFAAHSQIISTSPVDGAVLTVPPKEVRITFDAPLLDDTDTISINDYAGNVVFTAHPRPQGASVAVPWPSGTEPGEYQIAYRIVCGDGHVEIGALHVTITGTAAGSTTTTARAADTGQTQTSAPAASPPTSASGSVLPLAIAAAIVVGAVIAVGVVLVARREPAHNPR